MSDAARQQTSAERPEAIVLLELITGKWVSQAVYVAAELGIADVLKDGPRSSAEIARITSSSEDGIYRLLRALTNVGLFTERAGRQFELTGLGQHLRSDVPGSLRGVFGAPVFEFTAKDSAAATVLNDTMTSMSTIEATAITMACDFKGNRKLVDVGGGHGLLLATILKANPGLEGVLFEMPHALEGATNLFQKEGVADRCKVVGGNFFEFVPEGGDTYVMKHIIHDWDDEQSLKILRNCHRAMQPQGRLLVVEGVLPGPNEPDFGKLLDLEMLALTQGGRERTEQEFRKLYDAAGFKLTRVVRTLSQSSVVEGLRV